MAPGKELDARIAEKVMGWTRRVDIEKARDAQTGLANDYRLYKSPKKSYVVNEHAIPHYSTDIAAAWEVVEKLCSSFYMRWDDSDCSWQVSLDQKRRLADDCRGWGYADTAPHAICLAALRAVGEIE